jgi:hypothetical protein
MPESRLARTRAAYDDFVYDPPQRRLESSMREQRLRHLARAIADASRSWITITVPTEFFPMR